MVEVSKNIDGYWFSQFYHKDRGGKLAMGALGLGLEFWQLFLRIWLQDQWMAVGADPVAAL